MTRLTICLSSLVLIIALTGWSCANPDKAPGPDQAASQQEKNAMKTNSAPSNPAAGLIPEPEIARTIQALLQKFPTLPPQRVEKGVRQTAALWRAEDGAPETFHQFCLENILPSEKERETALLRISKNLESLWGHLDMIRLDFQWAQQIVGDETLPIDYIFGGYDPGAHWRDDFYRNKIAFSVILNFPFYSLQEKTASAPGWKSLDWACARLGDEFTSRIPPALIQDYSRVNSAADVYISDYNIMAGHLLNDQNETLFPRDLKLLSHWNLRDQIKSDYISPRGEEKQQIIYQVMKRIIRQDIPRQAINNDHFDWNPITNKLYHNGKEIAPEPETDARYGQLLAQFHAQRAMDPYFPAAMNTYIKRQFDDEMEISQPEVEALFTRLLSSPQAKQAAELIRRRLNRNLRPYDIWYNGFSPQSGASEEKLNELTRNKYPDAQALEKDLQRILLKLGFSREHATFLASRIAVDPARGSGHARGAQMKTDKARLRTRIHSGGMDYKGYNIAVHEFGHNVEQTISLHDVEYYILAGVPNTAFTEALAFIFQKRDLELLDIKEPNPDKIHMLALDTFWSVYEMMGVSLVDMRVWKWLYDHPDADARQLKDAVIAIAVEVWNQYYAGAFGVKDEPILAIYSHMISYPLYLSNYSYGHLIDFQLEQHLSGKDFAKEVRRMFSAGRLTPREWMKRAVNSEISIDPLLAAVDEALQKVH